MIKICIAPAWLQYPYLYQFKGLQDPQDKHTNNPLLVYNDDTLLNIQVRFPHHPSKTYARHCVNINHESANQQNVNRNFL